MKSWAKKLETMLTDKSIELTEAETLEMMDDIIAGAAEGFKVRTISIEELAEIEATSPYKTPTIH